MSYCMSRKLFEKLHFDVTRLSQCISSIYRHNSKCKKYGSLSPSFPLRVLFFGTDDFSVESLRALCNNMKNDKLSVIRQLDVVTAVRAKRNSVQTFALNEQLRIYDWPPQINKGDYDLGLVVSFGHLIPEHIINSFPLGMLNVHASLLPRWRGAAPIIYAIMNGDVESGVTIMRIKPKKFDIGDIVSQARCPISLDNTLPEVYQRLAELGSELLLDSIRDLPNCLQGATVQTETEVTYAPRVTSALAQVNWQHMDSTRVYNLSRALHGFYPLVTHWHGQPVKLFPPSSVSHETNNQSEPGVVELHRPSKTLRVACKDLRYVSFSAVSLAGKKAMQPIDFYNGYLSKHKETERRFSDDARLETISQPGRQG